MTRLVLAPALRDRIAKEAAAAFPRECCGLIEGVCDGTWVDVVALHPARNLAQEPDRFEIDPAEHIRVLRAARERGHAIVGCYHSHPNGKSEPSQRDREEAAEEDFIWLIQAVGPAKTLALAGFVFKKPDFRPIEIV